MTTTPPATAPCPAAPLRGDACHTGNAGGNMRFFISNSAHPCTEIALDANRIRLFYQANGWVETSDAREADDLIVSTCAYNQHFEDAALADVRLRREQLKTGARLITTGCLPQIDPDAFKAAGGREVVTPRDLGRFDRLIAAQRSMADVNGNTIRLEEYQANPAFMRLVKIHTRLEALRDRIGIDLVPHWMATIPTPKWFFIRGSVGCRGRCTYCAVRRSKGALTSVEPERIVAQVRYAVAHGAHEISLAGDDMGAWGTDIGSELAALLTAMLAVPGEFKINLRFVEPVYILRQLDRLLPVFATGRISAFCLPLQSGSDAVLARMQRDYRIADVEDGLRRIASLPRRPRLASIIMVGFPGETEADFLASAALIDRLPIDLYQILEYEGRPGTPSIAMPDQIDAATKKRRHDQLLRKFKLQKVVGLPAALANRLAGLRY